MPALLPLRSHPDISLHHRRHCQESLAFLKISISGPSGRLTSYTDEVKALIATAQFFGPVGYRNKSLEFHRIILSYPPLRARFRRAVWHRFQGSISLERSRERAVRGSFSDL